MLGRALEKIFPGYLENVDKTQFMNWPGEKWSLCGYSAPAPGEVTTKFPLLHEGFENRIFFAGEYADLHFGSFMEGALHSGVTLASRLAEKLNIG